MYKTSKNIAQYPLKYFKFNSEQRLKLRKDKFPQEYLKFPGPDVESSPFFRLNLLPPDFIRSVADAYHQPLGPDPR
jgi:hypothetical protein